MEKIIPALIKARKAFGLVLKDKANAAFKSKYADLSACLEAVDGALLANDILLMQEVFEADKGVTIETCFYHSSGEVMRCGKVFVPATKGDAHGFGSSLTYCRRYSLLTACGIAPEDDDGNAATKAQQVAQATKRETEQADQARKEARGAELEELALYMIDCHEQGKELDAINVWYEPKTWTDDKTEEQLYVWGLLKTNSKLRAAIKANKPEAVKESEKAQMEATA